MIQHLLAAASLLYPNATPPFVIIQPEAIPQLVCFGKSGVWSGSAFRVGHGLMLSVNHVTSNGTCFIDGKQVTLLYKSPDADFSEIADTAGGPFIEIDCGGFVKDRKYLALGHARAYKEVTPIELTATGETDKNGQAILEGMFSVIPGQSGGPVIDEQTGKVVGTVNMENYEEGLSWSVPLSSTPLCKAKIA